MNDPVKNKPFDLNPDETIHKKVNYIQQGQGAPILMVHGIAASLHDWDDLVPELASRGYAAYALDLLGHGESAKPASRAYHIQWLFGHFADWVDSLHLSQPPVFIGHSLGGYLVLEYARRFPSRTRGLILSNPYYHHGQLSRFLRLSYRRPSLNSVILERTPQWMFRAIVDATSIALGRNGEALHHLPEKVRIQTVLDYKRTAPGVYHIPNTITDLSSYLPKIDVSTLVVWGDRDLTLAPGSFPPLVKAIPRAAGRIIYGAGHVPHQSHTGEFNPIIFDFLQGLQA